MAPVDGSTDEGGHNLLAFFYSNPLVYEDIDDEESGRVVKKEVKPALDHLEVCLQSRKYETD